ncbi:hypothetical protein [Myxosarcina sp. GI1]|uniref:hypothetical protein n=1 Tax=Myxosarcina sp. GI1 TaxID=1541065 RepID=UPI00056238EE|nr:hypothetical protein [Myxosarcina sp. GI1]
MENLIFSAILYLIPVLFFYCPIVKALYRAIAFERTKRDRLNSIPFASPPELFALAEEYRIFVPTQIDQYDLQNVLIAQLC